jgi:hypothetical protein
VHIELPLAYSPSPTEKGQFRFASGGTDVYAHKVDVAQTRKCQEMFITGDDVIGFGDLPATAHLNPYEV